MAKNFCRIKMSPKKKSVINEQHVHPLTDLQLVFVIRGERGMVAGVDPLYHCDTVVRAPGGGRGRCIHVHYMYMYVDMNVSVL